MELWNVHVCCSVGGITVTRCFGGGGCSELYGEVIGCAAWEFRCRLLGGRSQADPHRTSSSPPHCRRRVMVELQIAPTTCHTRAFLRSNWIN